MNARQGGAELFRRSTATMVEVDSNVQSEWLAENPGRMEKLPRVVWDMTFAAKSLTGTRVFTRKLFDAIAAAGEWALSETNVVATPRAERTGNALTGARNIWWLQSGLPRALRAERADLFHAAAYLGPARAPCPMIVNVLDTTFLAAPADFDWKWRFYARTSIPATVHRAAAILTLSEHARGEIARAYNVPPARIHVVYPGVGDEYRPIRETERMSAVRARYSLPEQYLLFVGAQEPRKNIPALVKALAIVRRACQNPELVLVGPRGRGSPELEGVIAEAGLKAVIHDLGFVPQEDMPALYTGARAFVYPSRLEGFGMPPVEAMACGTPVIAAPNPPLPQVLADAAWFTANDSPEALAAGIVRVLQDTGLADELRRWGVRRAREFSWERAAHATMQVYADVLQAARSRAVSGQTTRQ